MDMATHTPFFRRPASLLNLVSALEEESLGYAAFLHVGPYENLGETYRAIFAGWLPASGEELRDAPCYEVYLNRDPRRTKPENLRTEIHVPLREEGH
jgi:DNA gyrase inhibitor GyrI